MALSIFSDVVSCSADFNDPENVAIENDHQAPEVPSDFEPAEDGAEARCIQLADARMNNLVLAGVPEHKAVSTRIATVFPSASRSTSVARPTSSVSTRHSSTNGPSARSPTR